MIDFYTYPTFNGQRVSIMLEEIGVEYRVCTVDLSQGEQRKPDFLAINPSGRIPTIVDHDEAEGFVVT
jgi:GST-like protein